MTEISENRDRFLRLNPARTDKAVKAIETLAQTGNTKTYEYTPQEAQDCFEAIEEAAGVLWESLGLGDAQDAPQEVSEIVTEPVATPDHGISKERLRISISRSKIDRAIRYIEAGNTRDALTHLKAVSKISDEDCNGGDITG